MQNRRSAGKLRGFYTRRELSIDLDKSLATGEKRYVPKIGGKRLRLSWGTHTKAEVYGNAVKIRYEKKLLVINTLIQMAQKEN